MFKISNSITISNMMTVVPKPKDEKIFSGKAVILFGGYDKEAMRRWQERVRAEKREQPNGQSADESAAD